MYFKNITLCHNVKEMRKLSQECFYFKSLNLFSKLYGHKANLKTWPEYDDIIVKNYYNTICHITTEM